MTSNTNSWSQTLSSGDEIRCLAAQVVYLTDTKHKGDVAQAASCKLIHDLVNQITLLARAEIPTRPEDPFSEEYFEAQVSLYRALSGKELDQKSGELLPVDLTSSQDHANAMGLPTLPLYQDISSLLPLLFAPYPVLAD